MEPRVLDKNLVTIAETFRSRGALKKAVGTVNQALGEQPFSKPEIFNLVQNPDQAIILGELARIRTDSAISIANRSFLPWTAIGSLGTAVKTIDTIYRNDSVERAVGSIKFPQNFLVEMGRDVFKAYQALAQFYGGEEKQKLLDRGEFNLRQARYYIPEEDPLRDLVNFELAMSQMDRGAAFEATEVVESIRNLLKDGTNPHRTQTIAAWALARRDKIGGSRSFQEEVARNYYRLESDHPEHGPIYQNTKRKMQAQKLRSMIMRAGASLPILGEQLEQYKFILNKE